MFEGITRGLSDALKKMRGRGRLTEANIRDGLLEVRRALLEADVNFTVVGNFIARVEERSVGQDVLAKIDPSEQIVKIVYDELVQLMGPVDHKIRYAKDRPTILMMCGLQGSGKTTTCAKLALMLQKAGRKPLLVAADLQRPAAVDQLKVLGEQINIPVFSEKSTPVDVCRNAAAYAKQQGLDTVILDTAGRLQIDAELMEELKQIDRLVRPDEVFLVCDAMIGQEAANVSKTFNDALELNGVILTKLDGDARGGAALSIKEITNVPIKFIGVGEKLNALEPFRPESMASRILGQGDLMGLVEKVAEIQSGIQSGSNWKSSKEARRRELHARRLPDAVRPVAKDGHEGPDRPHARHVRHDPGGRRPGSSPEARAGHDRLDDQEGTQQPRHHRHQPPPPHRRRLRHGTARGQ